VATINDFAFDGAATLATRSFNVSRGGVGGGRGCRGAGGCGRAGSVGAGACTGTGGGPGSFMFTWFAAELDIVSPVVAVGAKVVLCASF
jgi:hypothetical protein